MSTLEVNTIAPQSGTTITLGGSGDTVSLGSGATQSGFGGIFESQLLHVRDEKSQNTSGGTAASNGTQTRTLNTVKTNEITGASLSSNQITLPSGTYYIQALAPAYDTSRSQAFLYNVTDTANEIIGSTSTNTVASTSFCHVIGRFTISAQKVFSIVQFTFDAHVNGLGEPANNSTEVYTDVQIWKVA